tara:strand:- start:3027 stop:3782 length:756 start_codon:yes stop_codon:yes gene_type:complete
MQRERFEEDGFVILNTNLSRNNKFIDLTKRIYNSLEEEIISININKVRGSIMGNLNVYPGNYGDELLDILKSEGTFELIENILSKKIEELTINYGGNLSLPNKGEQHFHIDGGYNKEMYLMSISTEDISEINGPTEVCVGSHKKYLPFWKFVFSKKNKKKILLNKGDIVLRKHSLWHRGTKNISKKNRLLLSFIIFPQDSKYQIKLNKTSELAILPNFFKQNNLGLIHELIYSKTRPLLFLIKFVKSLIFK